jgi:hypothetical protein
VEQKQSVTLPSYWMVRVMRLEVTLNKGSVSLDVTVLPATAKPVLVVDGKHASSLVVDGLASGDQHKVIISAPGFVEQSIVFLGAPQEKKHLDVTLVKEQHHVAGHTTTSTNAAAPVGNGKLNVATNSGWCNVAVDGANKGATPVAGLELSAGPHKVTCTSPDGKSQTATVTVPTDGTARYRFTL